MTTQLVNRIHLKLKNIPTRYVTLYPSRALVCREIEAVDLKPGPNEVEVYGITPTADEHSVKVDGFGAASVTDTTIALVDNKEIFSQVYANEIEADLSDSDDDDDDEDSSSDEPETIKTIRTELLTLQKDLDHESTLNTALEQRLAFLNQYFSAPPPTTEPSKLTEALEGFQREFVSLQADVRACNDRAKDLRLKIYRQSEKLRRATRGRRHEIAKADAAKAKKRETKRAERDAARKEKRRVLDELAKYWPKKVYRLTIHLDVSLDTPSTSRSNSISSVTLAKNQPSPFADALGTPAKLALTYITNAASWSPRYDIEFATASNTGKINYRAEFINHTSEIWSDAKISLSTSAAAFSGLDDEAPWMNSWKINLQKHGNQNGALVSLQEANYPKFGLQTRTTVFNRDALFGAASYSQHPPKPSMTPAPAAERSGGGLFRNQNVGEARARMSYNAPLACPAPAPSGGVFSSTHGAALFGSAAPPAPSLQVRRAPAEFDHSEEEDGEDAGRGGNRFLRSGSGNGGDSNDTSWEDHGLSTTYELPGLRTLAPSSITRRHRIATLPFGNLVLPSIAVPKLRPAAFLRARFRNPSSSITLLKGTAGLTLDGTFLGTTTLPRVSPNESITLPLGIDPAVHVSYAKPAVKRSTQGVFNKESAHMFTRSIIIKNTKTVPVELLVIDQIPMSEEERLRVELVQPRGLLKEGDSVSAGVNADDTAKNKGGKGWGKATASLKKNGEVSWQVNLDRGAAVRLHLEYEAKAPANEVIVSGT